MKKEKEKEEKIIKKVSNKKTILCINREENRVQNFNRDMKEITLRNLPYIRGQY
jgi:hypothetical protein